MRDGPHGLVLAFPNLSSVHIDRVCDGLKVGGIDAVPDPAEVVEFEAVGNGAHEKLVGEPVDTDLLSTYREIGVPGPVHSRRPDPTASANERAHRPASIHVAPEAL